MIYMVLAIGDARTYQGNLGYEDDPKRLYVFDSTVPNSNRVSPGDIFVVVDPHSVVGIGVVESISESKETKQRKRCPICRSADLRLRKNMTPPYRCNDGKHTFSDPAIEMIQVTKYSSFYQNTFIDNSELGLTRDQVRSISRDAGSQHSIRPLNEEKFYEIVDESKINSLRTVYEWSTQGLDTGKLDFDETFSEGALIDETSLKRRRDPKLRRLAAKHWKSQNLWRCIVCEWKQPDELESDVLELHHLMPLSEYDKKGMQLDLSKALENLVPTCPRCHRIIHSKKVGFYTVEQAKSIIRK